MKAKLFSHPRFLDAIGTALNFNHQRKAWLRRMLTASWKTLQLPNRRDQERTLYLIHELHHRIAKLEAAKPPTLVARLKRPASVRRKPNPAPTKNLTSN
jgi:hypothetical protein